MIGRVAGGDVGASPSARWFLAGDWHHFFMIRRNFKDEEPSGDEIDS